MYLDVCNIENFEKVGQSSTPITQCFLYIPLKLDENKSTLFLIHKSWLCRCTQVCPTFLFKNNYCLLCFPSPPRRKEKFFIDQATLVLTNNFLKLDSFSRTIHILISAANLANLLDLPENLATDFFKKKSITFFDFCRYPGRTKQHFCFCLVLGFSWDSERKLNLHCKKYFLAMCIAIFLM